jgi:hypothetical protein
MKFALKSRSFAMTALSAICLSFSSTLFAVTPQNYVGVWEKIYPNGSLAEVLILRANGTAEVVEYHPDGRPQSVKRLATWSVKDGQFHARFSYIALRSVGGGWTEIAEERLQGSEMFIGPTSVPVRLTGSTLDIGKGASVFARKSVLQVQVSKKNSSR